MGYQMHFLHGTLLHYFGFGSHAFFIWYSIVTCVNVHAKMHRIWIMNIVYAFNANTSSLFLFWVLKGVFWLYFLHCLQIENIQTVVIVCPQQQHSLCFQCIFYSMQLFVVTIKKVCNWTNTVTNHNSTFPHFFEIILLIKNQSCVE